MSINKSELASHGAPKSITALIGAKTITSASAYRHGTVLVIEFLFSDASTNFIKDAGSGGLEIGGTLEMGTGTKVSW